MIIIGITGGIASGKSNVCSVIRNEGYEVIDCDKITRELQKPQMPLYNAIVKEFGPGFLNQDKTLNRARLGELIFNDSSKRERLDELAHPLIMKELLERLARLNTKIAFIEVPLLYEAKFDIICDKTLCVYIPRELQIERLILRDKIDRNFAIAKINSQMSLDLKKSRSDYAIISDGDFNQTKKRTLECLNKIIKDINS